MTAINDNVEYLELCCDSFDATVAGGQFWKGTSNPGNEIIYSWPKFYWSEKSPDIIGIKVVSAEIPNVWDTISLANNTFVYTTGGVPTTITVPVGNYTGAALATNLQTQISAITAGMTVTFDTTLLQFVFTQTISAVAWSLTFGSKATLYSVLGFIPGSVNAAVGAGSIVRSTIIANVSGPYYLYLNSRIMGPLINFNLTDGNNAAPGGPQIARIPVNVQKNSVVFYTDPNPTFYFDFFAGSKFETFDLYLSLGSDQDQTPLDMKGAPWSVKLGLVAYREATRNLANKPSKRGSSLIS